MSAFTVTPLAPPRYPDRSFIRRGECGHQPVEDLERWVAGLPFHPYGVRASDPRDGETIHDAVERCRENPGVLSITGELLSYRRALEFWISYRQVGDSDGRLSGGGAHMSVEDACYACLVMIEADERAAFEQRSVVGLA